MPQPSSVRPSERKSCQCNLIEVTFPRSKGITSSRPRCCITYNLVPSPNFHLISLSAAVPSSVYYDAGSAYVQGCAHADGTYRDFVHPSIFKVSNWLCSTVGGGNSCISALRNSSIGICGVEVIDHLSVELISSLRLATACIPPAAGTTSTTPSLTTSRVTVGF